jgi:hypothetical protein
MTLWVKDGEWSAVSKSYYKNAAGDWVEWYSATPQNMEATGGTITQSGGFRVHTFNSSGTFSVTANPTDVDYLVIAGGGGGGRGTSARNWGGGGAGGVARQGTIPASQSAHSVVVGAGGADSSVGVTSSFNLVSSTGGGSGNTGWSGGSNADFSGTQASSSVDGRFASAGAGAGAGGPGSGINGGVGIGSSILGASLRYGGGGAGGIAGDGAVVDGGGRGYNTSAAPGVPNTGGGASGGGSDFAAAGGSGIVIIRYPYN